MLCRRYGAEYMDLAEDIVSEVFLRALERWTYQGLPPQPTAWLYTVAKNLATNAWLRQTVFQQRVAPQLVQESLNQDLHTNEIWDWSDEQILDAELSMLFVCCHPRLPEATQIALSLRLLCGLNAAEIATALLSSTDAVERRLRRGKAILRDSDISITLPSNTELATRLHTVCTTLYLLFSEGYYSESNDAILREDLCAEAMHLVELLMKHKLGNSPSVHALYALMCFQSSRFAARRSATAELILYAQQDPSLWDAELIQRGVWYLHHASQGSQLSDFHLEATIAYWHTQHVDSPEKWQNILALYDLLLLQKKSPLVALNRILALSKVQGNTIAKAALEKLRQEKLVLNDHYSYLVEAELQEEGSSEQLRCLQRAVDVCKHPVAKTQICERLMRISGGTTKS